MNKLLLVIIPLLFSCGVREASDLDSLFRTSGAVGMSVVSVTKNGEVEYNNYGYSNKISGLGVSENSVFPVASLTKVFTAIGIMQLVEKGDIDLYSPVVDYIPEFNKNDIRVKDLLTHYSGLPGDLGFNKNQDFRDSISIINREDIGFKPRELFLYSNVNFSLLGMIIEEISGNSYEEYIIERVLKPLGVLNSGFNPYELTNVVKIYSEKDVVPYPENRDTPAGGLYISTKGLSLLISDLLSDNPVLLTRETRDLMFEKSNRDLPMGNVFDIGISFGIDRENSSAAFHYGDEVGTHSILYILPDKGVGGAVLINSDEGKSVRLPTLKMALNKPLIKSGEHPLTSRKKVNNKPVPLEHLEYFNGIFSGFPGHVILTSQRDTLKMKLLGIPLTLGFDGVDTFYPELKILGIPLKIEFLEGVSFKVVKEDKLYLAPYIDGVFLGFLEKTADITYGPEWEGREGVYKSDSSREYLVSYNNKINYWTVSYSWGGMTIESILSPVDSLQGITVGHAQNCGQIFSFDKMSFRGDHNLRKIK